METRRTEKKHDVEALLRQGQTIQIRPQGYSMYPLFLPGRDEAIIAPLEARPVRRGDVILYRRTGSILVLHRVWKREETAFYAVGDHQTKIEGPLELSCVRGILTGVIRNGRSFSTENLLYRLLSGLWLRLRPARPALFQVAAKLKAIVCPRT